MVAASRGYTLLITGAGGPAGVNTVLSLRRSRIFRLITTDVVDICEGAFLSHKHYTISPALNERAFLRDLADVIEKEMVDLVIPTVDEEIIVLAKHVDQVSFSSKIIMHPRETIDICSNKLMTYQYLERVVPQLIPEYSTSPKNLSCDTIVKKPQSSRGSRNVVIGRRCSMEEEDGYFFVEYLPGREWTVDIVTDRDGNPMVIVPRIRLKTRCGISVIGLVRLDREVIECARKVLSALKFTGSLNIQFKEDANSNLKLLEINPRFSGGLDISVAAGANLPRILVEYWLFNRRPKRIRIREGLYVKIYRPHKIPSFEYIYPGLLMRAGGRG